MKPFTPEDLENVFEVASSCDLILVGGQAVGCWSKLLEIPDEEPWKSRRPYTSKDADAICTRPQMLKFAKALQSKGWGVEVISPEGKETAINTGLLRIRGKFGGKSGILEMNLLQHLEGLSYQDVLTDAAEIPIVTKTARVIDPLRLLESKTISLNTLDQKNRQDKDHLELCVAMMNRILVETGKGSQWATAIGHASKIVTNSKHPLGLDTLTRHAINLLDAIPWEIWRNSGNSTLEQFGADEHQHRQQMRDSIQESEELENWYRQLNPKPHKYPR